MAMNSRLRAFGICVVSAAFVIVPAFASAGVSTGPNIAADQATPNTEPGFLSVDSTPPSRVLIDNVDTGKTTPLARHELTAGSHRVTLITLDNTQKRTLGVTIEAGKEKHLRVTF
jgi:hypothetical protein